MRFLFLVFLGFGSLYGFAKDDHGAPGLHSPKNKQVSSVSYERVDPQLLKHRLQQYFGTLAKVDSYSAEVFRHIDRQVINFNCGAGFSGGYDRKADFLVRLVEACQNPEIEEIVTNKNSIDRYGLFEIKQKISKEFCAKHLPEQKQLLIEAVTHCGAKLSSKGSLKRSAAAALIDRSVENVRIRDRYENK